MTEEEVPRVEEARVAWLSRLRMEGCVAMVLASSEKSDGHAVNTSRRSARRFCSASTCDAEAEERKTEIL